MSRSVVIASGVRTAIGDSGGSLAGISPCDFGAAVAHEAIARAGLTGVDIDQCVFGHVIHTATEDMYLVNDGAAALILMAAEAAAARGVTPLARIVSYGFGGVAPDLMGLGRCPLHGRHWPALVWPCLTLT